MRTEDIFALGLGLAQPWKLLNQRLDTEKIPHELHLEIGADRGTGYPCPRCGKTCKAHDFQDFTWRHLNFFQHHCYLTGRVPRIECPEHGIRRVEVPWARPGSNFTLLFEQVVMTLAREMPVATIADFVGTTDKRLWRVINHYVAEAMQRLDISGLEAFGLDETACKRGHRYVTIFIDLDREERPVIFVTEGKGKETVRRFRDHLLVKGGQPERVLEVVSDMSGSFVAAVGEHFPKAEVTVDWFHVVQLFTKAVEEVRKAEARERALPKGTRWGVLKGRETAKTQTQAEALQELEGEAFATGIAYRIKEQLRWIRRAETGQAAKWRATNFLNYAREQIGCEPLLSPMAKALRSFEKHLDRILFRWRSWHTNARLEGLNGLFQAARARARGYRNVANFITMIYLIAAPLGDLFVM
ncbi:Mobile element protein [Desulfovibrio sp. DV]|uniref:ISL3 family transposase n=1 Tax=Desulfovibrio sp. DV TaxID=1844708 RepID=UPI00094BC56B|nr:ISL3 family transposase [Desulfovibrio sp. DV]OLN30023.1 Mobile element protein [Desulfovibrio sp. DV]